MRTTEFIEYYSEDNQDSDRDGNIVTVLSLVQKKIQQGELKNPIPAHFIIRLIRNTGLGTFTLQDLKDANSQVPAIENMIKQITDDEITFVGDSSMPVTNTPDDYSGAVDNPQQTVSNMAKSAMKRRQS